MRKIATFLSILSFIGCSSFKKATLSHRDSISQKYPYTLIGDDYGILSEEDLALSSCVAKADPFTPEFKNIFHPYWQCFSTENSQLECSGGEYDSDEKSIMVIMAIVLQKSGVTHEYLSRRGIPRDTCEKYLKEWRNLTAEQSHVCISGALAGANQDLRTKSLSWIFESYKTRKGCDSYFDSGCSLKTKIQRGCDLAEMTANLKQ